MAVQRRPSWRAGAGAARGEGPHAWLTLLDGGARTAGAPALARAVAGPQNVAVEAGVVAADPRAHACVWTVGGEPSAIVRLTGRRARAGDGGGCRARGLRRRRERLARPGLRGRHGGGRRAHGADRGGRGAPVVAWARAGGVWSGPAARRPVLPLPGIRALALDAAGTRLVALDAASVLHVAAVFRSRSLFFDGLLEQRQVRLAHELRRPGTLLDREEAVDVEVTRRRIFGHRGVPRATLQRQHVPGACPARCIAERRRGRHGRRQARSPAPGTSSWNYARRRLHRDER